MDVAKRWLPVTSISLAPRSAIPIPEKALERPTLPTILSTATTLLPSRSLLRAPEVLEASSNEGARAGVREISHSRTATSETPVEANFVDRPSVRSGEIRGCCDPLPS